MRSFGIAEGYPVTDDTIRLEAIDQVFEIDRFLLQGSPEPFDEDVVHAPAAPVHRDAYASFGQRGDPSRPRKL
ncbi:hypothetical protein V6575_22220 [Roseibium sp. H3510]|uniref:Uncharacterized protein n=1 Tax=Roseibium algae TaxID=3123038 RepID=A0ABU8TRJ6_9HYPH